MRLQDTHHSKDRAACQCKGPAHKSIDEELCLLCIIKSSRGSASIYHFGSECWLCCGGKDLYCTEKESETQATTFRRGLLNLSHKWSIAALHHGESGQCV